MFLNLLAPVPFGFVFEPKTVIPDALDEIPVELYDKIPDVSHKYMFIAVLFGLAVYELFIFVNSTYFK
jgi:hypothetical protein